MKNQSELCSETGIMKQRPVGCLSSRERSEGSVAAGSETNRILVDKLSARCPHQGSGSAQEIKDCTRFEVLKGTDDLLHTSHAFIQFWVSNKLLEFRLVVNQVYRLLQIVF